MSIDWTKSSNLVISSSKKSVEILSSSMTQLICNFLIPYARGTSFDAPQRRPSASTERTSLSNSFMSRIQIVNGVRWGNCYGFEQPPAIDCIGTLYSVVIKFHHARFCILKENVSRLHVSVT